MKKLFYYPGSVADTLLFAKHMETTDLAVELNHSESRFEIVDDQYVIDELESWVLERKESNFLTGKVVVQKIS